MGLWERLLRSFVCICLSIIAAMILPFLLIFLNAAIQAAMQQPPSCEDYLLVFLRALGIPCAVAQAGVVAYAWFLVFAFTVIVLGLIVMIARCAISVIFWKEYKKYPRIYLNQITTEEESWFHRFEGSKKNKSDDCVIAAVSNVRVYGGYDSVIQPVAAGDTYKPNRGEDFDAFIHRDGSATKFRGRLGSFPLIGEENLSPSEAATQFGQYMPEAMRWFADHPNC